MCKCRNKSAFRKVEVDPGGFRGAVRGGRVFEETEQAGRGGDWDVWVGQSRCKGIDEKESWC